ncbi:MAG: outer membrane protein assembly factor BamD [Cyclobacteriaceae bacterium]
MSRVAKNLILILVLITSVSCTKFRKIQKSSDWKVKYEAALEYYEEKDYFRSNTLLEEILPIIRGTEEAEKANFIYAYTFFEQRQYILSSHYFKTFTDVYGRSKYVEEAAYMNAYSLYKQSPQASLDQTSTYEALIAMQSFLNRYPNSTYAKEADELIDDMQQKLEFKAYENAKLYYKLRRYKAAIIAVENFNYDYPDSKYREELNFLAIETAFELAEVSIYSVQEERYRKVVSLYESFVDRYPSSKFIKQAEQYYADSIEQLSIFADRNNKN